MTEKSNRSLGKRGFNIPHVFDRSVIILLIIYALVLTYILFLKASMGTTSYYYYYDDEYNNMSHITFIAGVLVSLVQFAFLQKKSKCITTLSFGESRKSLFRKKFWFPLIAMVLMTVCFYLILFFVDKKLRQGFLILYDEHIANFLIALLPLIVGYVAGVFARIASGKTSETIYFGASVCAFPYAFFSFVDAIFSLSLRGYYTVVGEYYTFSNYNAVGGHTVTTIFSLFDPLYTLNYNVIGFLNKETSTGLWFETPAFYIIKNFVWICIFIASAFLIEKFFVKSFKAENCDKIGKNKFVRIISVVSTSLFVSQQLLLSVYGNIWTDIQNVLMFGVLAIVLVISLIVTAIVTLVLYRNKQQLRFCLSGVGITAVSGLIICVVSVTGCFGYSTYMPDSEKIKSVMINDCVGLLPFYGSDYLGTEWEEIGVDVCFKNPEEIELVKDVHNFIANDKNCDTTDMFSIVYELEDGNVVCRTYPYISRESCEKISTLWESDTVRGFYKTIFNQNPEINSENTLKEWFVWERDFIYNGNYEFFADDEVYGDYYEYEYYNNDCTGHDTIAKADSLVIFSKDGDPTYITDKQISRETMEALKKALYTDYMNMRAQQFFNPQEQIGVISLVSCSLLVDYAESWWDLGENKITSEEVIERYGSSLCKFPVTPEMVNTIKVLKSADVYKYFKSDLKIEKAHLIDSQKLITWYNLNDEYGFIEPDDRDGNDLSSSFFCWYDWGTDTYLEEGCKYIKGAAEGWYSEEYGTPREPISESDIEVITPEEAAKLREKAFMAYNAGNQCRFLVIKYTNGTANILMIPN